MAELNIPVILWKGLTAFHVEKQALAGVAQNMPEPVYGDIYWHGLLEKKGSRSKSPILRKTG